MGLITDEEVENFVPDPEIIQQMRDAMKEGKVAKVIKVLPPYRMLAVRTPETLIERMDELVGKYGETRSDVLRLIMEKGLDVLES